MSKIYHFEMQYNGDSNFDSEFDNAINKVKTFEVVAVSIETAQKFATEYASNYNCSALPVFSMDIYSLSYHNLPYLLVH